MKRAIITDDRMAKEVRHFFEDNDLREQGFVERQPLRKYYSQKRDLYKSGAKQDE